jgi:hypothetical protein
MRMTIDFEKPPAANVDDVAEFVLDALSSWGGGLHPEDPMFHSLRGKIHWVKVYGKTFRPDEARYGK